MDTILNVKRIVDVDASAVVRDGFVWVRDGIIHDWGGSDSLPDEVRQARVMTFSDHTLLPGLINSHAHLCLPSRGVPFYQLQRDNMALLNAVHNMRRELESGVTTVRDCGDQNGVLFDLREALEKGLIEGPRLLLCGPPLTVTGGHAHFLGGEADGEDGLRRAVRDRIARGADFVKVMATGGGTPGSFPALPAFTSRELSAAVEAAHILGKPVAAHCRGIPGIRQAIECGIDHIEHACFEKPTGVLAFDPEIGKQIAEKKIGITPTVQLYRDNLMHLSTLSEGRDVCMENTERITLLNQNIEEKKRMIRKMIAMGIACVAGNDAGLPYTEFGEFWKELDAIVSAGLSHMQAIRAATRVPAETFGLAERVGSIQKGKIADLVVVAGDPTQQIRDLSRVELVMKSGNIIQQCAPEDGFILLSHD